MLLEPRCLGHSGDHIVDGQGILAADAYPATFELPSQRTTSDMYREKRLQHTP